ncbi:MAG: Xaa-Pro peptidase family protein [Actinobacteria bacterium]|nr:Xaa-Pro peptidase family protein [Actinomycetota bacterium]
MIWEHRRDLALARAAEAGCSALLITHPVNVRYLCGFDGSAGALLITPDRVVLATDGRYVQQAGIQATDCEVVQTRDYSAALLDIVRTAHLETVGCEGDHVSWNQHARMSELGVDVVATSGLIESLRMVKDSQELDYIRQACRLTESALHTTLDAVRVGVTERELARIFSSAAMDRGADGLAFDPIVAIGENAAIPHHKPGERALVRGDVVLCDVGASVGGYCADLSRTVVLGSASPDLIDIHDVVSRAQSAAMAGLAPGVAASDIDQLARDVIASAGFADKYVHGTGHGLGLEIHEPPLLGSSSTGTLGEHFVVTVEPGIYLPGVGGVRIEDTVLVTSNGYESLTTGTREFVEISV